eukprot:TRINITY_DN7121_c0_g1_i1.p1 TRINITY_DN7121_c0_g1~~TRINITY_DN7121_c0_g1_i1.p1  ORF type:complete len:238 (+),score=24.11 TRINITY_DN7121_c0_g1_i1:84-797(+)
MGHHGMRRRWIHDLDSTFLHRLACLLLSSMLLVSLYNLYNSPLFAQNFAPSPDPEEMIEVKPANSQFTPTGKEVVLSTDKGSIHLTLFEKEAPLSCKHFETLVDLGYYAGGSFYRAEGNYIAQGGGTPISGGAPPSSPLPDVPLEYKVPHTRGVVGLARPPGNTNGGNTEFFISMIDNSQHLKPGGADSDGYTGFALVTKGMHVIEKICRGSVREDDNGMLWLKHPVEIHEAVVLKT